MMNDKNERIIDYQVKMHTYPPAFIILNFLMTDWMLLKKHAQFAIGAFVILQAYFYRKNLHNSKGGFFGNFFSEEGLMDSIIFVGFVLALYGVSLLLIKLSEFIRGSSFDHALCTIDEQLTKLKGAKLTWTEKNKLKNKKI